MHLCSLNRSGSCGRLGRGLLEESFQSANLQTVARWADARVGISSSLLQRHPSAQSRAQQQAAEQQGAALLYCFEGQRCACHQMAQSGSEATAQVPHTAANLVTVTDCALATTSASMPNGDSVDPADASGAIGVAVGGHAMRR